MKGLLLNLSLFVLCSQVTVVFAQSNPEVGVTMSSTNTGPILGRNAVKITIAFDEAVVGLLEREIRVTNGIIDELTARNSGGVPESYAVYTFMLSPRYPSGASNVDVTISLPAGVATGSVSGVPSKAAIPLVVRYTLSPIFPSITPTATWTVHPFAPPTHTPIPIETVTPSPFTVTPTIIPSFTVTATPFSTVTPIPTSTATPIPVLTSTATATPFMTSTPARTSTSIPSQTAACATGPLASVTTLLVAPRVSGFGEKAVAGSGRHLAVPCTTLFRVNSLSDSGPGTLRECVEAQVPRTCVFEISGRISLKSDLLLTSPYITIAGQTAPSPGILLTGATLRIEAPEVLVQHLQIRPGDENTLSAYSNRDGIGLRAGVRDVFNVVVDHVSLSWAIDENVGLFNPQASPSIHDVTFSNSIIAEGLYKSKHSEGIHSMGMLVGEHTQNLSVHHSLFAHNNKRNPMIKGGCSVEFLNNVVYDWHGSLGSAVANVSNVEGINLPVFLNFIGNIYKYGTEGYSLPPVFGDPLDPRTRIYTYANIGPFRSTDSGNDWLITSLPEIPYRSSEPVMPLTDTEVLGVSDVYDYVLSNAGARVAERIISKVDARIVSEVRNRTGGLKDCISGCTRSVGGWPILATVRRSFTAPSDLYGDADGDGYTNLEALLHQAANDVEGRQ